MFGFRMLVIAILVARSFLAVAGPIGSEFSAPTAIVIGHLEARRFVSARERGGLRGQVVSFRKKAAVQTWNLVDNKIASEPASVAGVFEPGVLVTKSSGDVILVAVDHPLGVWEVMRLPGTNVDVFDKDRRVGSLRDTKWYPEEPDSNLPANHPTRGQAQRASLFGEPVWVWVSANSDGDARYVVTTPAGRELTEGGPVEFSNGAMGLIKERRLVETQRHYSYFREQIAQMRPGRLRDFLSAHWQSLILALADIPFDQVVEASVRTATINDSTRLLALVGPGRKNRWAVVLNPASGELVVPAPNSCADHLTWIGRTAVRSLHLGDGRHLVANGSRWVVERVSEKSAAPGEPPLKP